MKVLFVCNQNRHRSKTAEDIFKNKFEVKSAGLYNENPVTISQMEWADIIVVMEDSQRSEIAKRFPKQYMQKQIVSLDIPDIYSYGQPELVSLLKSRMNNLILATH
ncbi:MAG: phosphotyrosine protein phosphatase [Candidatus Woesearchaeota archaeon]|nr:MAG: phosphotyrosine protein phosphatase [Candidatus Woesearchaeota archaeon]